MSAAKAAAGVPSLASSRGRCCHPCLQARPLRRRAARQCLKVNALFPSYSGSTDTGSLHPGQYWYPAWMHYRQRNENYTFWTEKFRRNSTEIPDVEKRWTLLSTVWWAVRYWHFYMIPVWVRFFFSVLWREMLLQAYYLHKKLILQQAKLDAHLAKKHSNGVHSTFSRTMAMRRLHFKTGMAEEVMYYINLYKTGRVHLLPPKKNPTPRPSFGFIF